VYGQINNTASVSTKTIPAGRVAGRRMRSNIPRSVTDVSATPRRVAAIASVGRPEKTVATSNTGAVSVSGIRTA
jgi:hypothetical protein